MRNGFFLAVATLILGGTVACAEAPSTTAPQGTGQLPPAPATDPGADGGATAGAGRPELGCGSPDGNADPFGRLTLSTDYLLWWVRKGPSGGPLLTLGSANDAIPGALGQAGTVSLFGDGGLDYHNFSGMRLNASVGLTCDLALEGSYFVLESRSAGISANSDSAGNPLIARPVINDQAGLQESYSTSFPGNIAGRSDIVSHTQLQGYEINLAANVARSATQSLDLLAGYRYLNLREDLLFQDALVPLVPGYLTFGGGPADPPSTMTDFDSFHTSNHFYGGQVGARWQRAFGKLDVGVTGKVALGATQEQVAIAGATTLITPGAGAVTLPGGILAQTSNMGTYSRSTFAVVPEVGVNLGWRLTQNLSANVGYTFIYWSDVARPGAQIDSRINPALVPSDQDFGNGHGALRPAFVFHSSDFWAQGVNFGMTLRF